MPRWFVSRLVHDVKVCRITDSVLTVEALRFKDKADSTIAAADSLISIQRRQIDFRDQAIAVQTDRILNQQAANKELRDEVKKQKLLTIAVGVAGVLMLIIML